MIGNLKRQPNRWKSRFEDFLSLKKIIHNCYTLYFYLQLTHEMAQAAGIDCEFDAELYHALRNSKGNMPTR